LLEFPLILGNSCIVLRNVQVRSKCQLKDKGRAGRVEVLSLCLQPLFYRRTFQRTSSIEALVSLIWELGTEVPANSPWVCIRGSHSLSNFSTQKKVNPGIWSENFFHVLLTDKSLVAMLECHLPTRILQKYK
jgi:hypothetical protein